jgi:hypothetical protein
VPLKPVQDSPNDQDRCASRFTRFFGTQVWNATWKFGKHPPRVNALANANEVDGLQPCGFVKYG